MAFSNHGSTQFAATTDDAVASIVSDFWTVANRINVRLDQWQAAADNGYGRISQLGQYTDKAIDLLGQGSETAGRQSARVYRWWTTGGCEQIEALALRVAQGVAAGLFVLACLLCVAGFGLAALWQLTKRVPAQLEYALSLPEPQDNDGGWVGFSQVPAIPTAALTCWATEKFGVLQGASMSADEALAWARQLRG